jgi:hypothetical protein
MLCSELAAMEKFIDALYYKPRVTTTQLTSHMHLAHVIDIVRTGCFYCSSGQCCYRTVGTLTEGRVIANFAS